MALATLWRSFPHADGGRRKGALATFRSVGLKERWIHRCRRVLSGHGPGSNRLRSQAQDRNRGHRSLGHYRVLGVRQMISPKLPRSDIAPPASQMTGGTVSKWTWEHSLQVVERGGAITGNWSSCVIDPNDPHSRWFSLFREILRGPGFIALVCAPNGRDQVPDPSEGQRRAGDRGGAKRNDRNWGTQCPTRQGQGREDTWARPRHAIWGTLSEGSQRPRVGSRGISYGPYHRPTG